MAATLVDYGAIQLLSALQSYIYNSAKLVLFKAPTSFDRDTVYGDLTLADYSGFSQPGMTFDTIVINGDGKAELAADQVTFAHDGGGTANTVYGYAVVNTDTSTLYWMELFAEPKEMAEEGDVIKITPRFTLTDELLA